MPSRSTTATARAGTAPGASTKAVSRRESASSRAGTVPVPSHFPSHFPSDFRLQTSNLSWHPRAADRAHRAKAVARIGAPGAIRDLGLHGQLLAGTVGGDAM